MRFQLTPGNSFACRINTHRDHWRGTICEGAENWSCLATPDFRTDYCAMGDNRCFHLNAFYAMDPSIIIEEKGGGWLFQEAADALDDQILVLWGFRATTVRGIPDQNRRQIVFGAYRVKSVEQETVGYRTLWRVRPHSDGWTCFSDLHTDMPRYEKIGGPYINQLEASNAARIFSKPESAERLDGEDAKRFRFFCKEYPRWNEVAREKAQALCARLGEVPDSRPLPRARTSTILNQPLSGLRKLFPTGLPEAAQTTGPEAKPIPPVPEKARPVTSEEPVIIDPSRVDWIRETLGEDLCLELQVAFVTRDLVLLRGDPGVGKSHLALRLLDDPNRERTLVVPVSATWRGREDLLGYVNPMDGKFVPTPFTQFLEASAEAWRKGDRRARVVVFEEFNLSQPEHWLADILAVSQYEGECDRRIQLAGPGAPESQDVFLSPAIRFVATVNSDHTTRALSPRVLDRAAVVALELTAKEALSRIGLELSEPSITAIADIDFILRPVGASFSIRTARSLARCLERNLADDEAEAIDLILVQQVLSKVRLTAHDPSNLTLLGEVERWCERSGSGLMRCASVVALWRERLDAGMDILQA